MKPASFPEVNMEVDGLPCHEREGIVTTRWNVSWAERWGILTGGEAWVQTSKVNPYAMRVNKEKPKL